MPRAIRSQAVYPVSVHLPARAPAQGRGTAARLRPAALALSIAAAFTSLPIASQNLPVHRADVAGSSAITQSGNRMTVTTTNARGTQHSAIDWQSFSIGAGNAVRFDQPGATSTSINRVVTNTPSQIFGNLSSNGKLVLVNQSGITVGAGAVVDTAGFTASVLGMSDGDAAAGRLRFNADGLGQATGALQVQGTIVARGGDVVLIAPNVEVARTGVVEAPNGAAILAAGQSVEVTGRGLEGIRLTVQAPSDQAVNLGTLRGDAVGIFAGRLRHSGLIQATGASMEGGKVVLKAQDIAEVTGRIEARRVDAAGAASGGDVAVEARYAVMTGAVDVTGQRGGAVTVDAQAVLQAGAIDASGVKSGGVVLLRGTDSVVQTQEAAIRADAQTGAGGVVVVQAGQDGSLLSSASLSASGDSGGHVTVTGGTVRLQGAQVMAEGQAQGGTVLVGGGRHGNDPLVPNSQDLFVNSTSVLSASSRRRGNGGTVVLWSDGSTRFFGDIHARGAGDGSDGGWVEVSGKEHVQFSGTVDAAGGPGGARGTLLLDPKNITIASASGQAGVIELADPNYETGGTGDFGSSILQLDGNRVLVTDPSDSAGGANAGAIYVFDRSTGALLTALTGSHASDGVGGNYQSVYDYNTSANTFVFKATAWNGGVGAWTWINASASSPLPASGVISAANSFVGLSVGDLSSANLSYSSGSNMLLRAPNYEGGKGAVAMVSSTSFAGTLNLSNAFMGSTTSDHVGSGGTTSVSGGMLLLSPAWNGNAGAITAYDPNAPLTGTLSSANSLVGSAAGDQVGQSSGIRQFESGRLFIFTSAWGGGQGAFTVIDSLADLKGVVSATNSLTGLGSTDGNGFQIQNCLTSGYCSGYYNYGAQTFIVSNTTLGSLGGSVTVFLDHAAASQPVGAISSSNSLVGSAGDRLGSDGVQVMSTPGGGALLVRTPSFSSGAGAITYASLTSAPTGALGAANSVVGQAAGDFGSYVLHTDYVLNGNVLLVVPNHDGGKGAMTLLTPGMAGTLSSANALVGATATDHVGSGGIDKNSGYYWILRSPQWDGSKGAMTIFEPGDPAPTGVVSGTANSWVGESAGDQVGANMSFTLMSSHNAVVLNRNFAGGKGAITLITDLGMPYGTISSANSWVGATTSDGGGMNVGAYSASGYGASGWSSTDVVMVSNAYWNSGTGFVALIGAGQTALTAPGSLSAANALVGAASGDYVGSAVGVVPGTTPYVVVRSPDWGGGKGAITFGTLASGGLPVGTVSASNSLVGSAAGDLPLYGAQLWVNYGIGSGLDYGIGVAAGRALLVAPDYAGGLGAVSLFDLSAPPTGTLTSGQALMGVSAGDRIGSGGVMRLDYQAGDYALVLSPEFSGQRGAITSINLATGATSGTLSSANSFVGAYAGDGVGNQQNNIVQLYSGAVLLVTPSHNSGRGALTMFTDASAMSGTIDPSSSLVGATPGDFVNWSHTDFDDHTLYLSLPEWTNAATTAASAGARLRITDAVPLSGTIGSANALVGTHAGDRIGSGYLNFSGSYADFLDGQWNGGRGVRGFITYGQALTGTVDAPTSGLNAVLGTAAGDLASSIVLEPSDDKRVLIASNYGGGKGAIATLDLSAGVPGAITLDATNALVGATAGDHIGSSGYNTWGSNGYMIGSPSWSSSTGALTFSDASGLFGTGVIGSSNSLVGSAAGDAVGSNIYDITRFGNGKLLLIHRQWGAGTTGSGKGALTLLQSPAQASGVIDASNSLVGANAGDGAYFYVTAYSDSGSTYYYDPKTRAVVSNPYFNGNRGMVTLIDSSLSSSPAGVIGAANSLVGSTAGDQVGTSVDVMPDGIFVRSPQWSGAKGAITYGSLSSLPVGEVSAANSLVGAQTGDQLGSSYLYRTEYRDTNYYYTVSSYLSGGLGGVTFMPLTGATGTLSLSNTVFGTAGEPYGPQVSEDYYAPEFLRVRFSGGSGRVLYVNPDALAPLNLGNVVNPPMPFAGYAGQDVTITTQSITAMTNAGTDVVLQASNDIVVNSAITTVPSSGDAGSLLLEAGRSIRLNASIRTGGGDLGLYANSSGADAAWRDAGAGGISTASGVTIDLGGGGMIARVGTGVAGAAGGTVELGQIDNGAGLLVQNLSTSANAGIAQVPGTVWNVSKLAMETHGQNGAIGTLAQAIHFTGDEVAVRTTDAPANLQHLGAQLYLTTATLDGGQGSGLNADPGYRGIVLGGVGSLNLRSEGNIDLYAAGSAVGISAHNVVIETPQGSFTVQASDAPATVLARRELQIIAGEDVVIHGGTTSGAYASVISQGTADVVAGAGVYLQGGSGAGSYALLDPVQAGSTLFIQAPLLQLAGGSGAGAYAAVISQGGNATLQVEQLKMTAGAGANADAIILAPNGQALAQQTGFAYLGTGNPLDNATSDTGFGTVIVATDVLQQQFLADQSLMSSFLSNYNDELLRQRRRSLRGDIVLEGGSCSR
jgi:filamentous hemagglutinin family protein